MNPPADLPPRDKPTRMVVVESQPFFVLGIENYLHGYPQIKLVAHTTNAADAFEVVEAHHPDLVLADVCLPGKSGIELVAQLRSQAPWLKTIVYSAHVDDHYITDAIDAGINGYLLKDDKPEILLKAVETVMKGEQYLSEAIAGRLLRLMQHTKTNPIKPHRKIIFSDVEVAVMRENCKGLSDKEIGCKLNMKERNVRSILENLHKKLGIRTNVQLAMCTVREHIVDPWE